MGHRKEPYRYCEVCGGPVASWSKTGICSLTPACRRARDKLPARRSRQVELARDRRAGVTRSTRQCERCGGPLRNDSTTGICQRNPECALACRQVLDARPERRQYQRSRLDAWIVTPIGIKHRMVNAARARAKKRGEPFTITVADVPDVPELCPLLGIPLAPKSGGNSPSLDRIDPTAGYTPGNVWVVSTRANLIKQDATPQELMRIATILMDMQGHGTAGEETASR